MAAGGIFAMSNRWKNRLEPVIATEKQIRRTATALAQDVSGQGTVLEYLSCQTDWFESN
jgi:hypothetical protein